METPSPPLPIELAGAMNILHRWVANADWMTEEQEELVQQVIELGVIRIFEDLP